MIACFSVNWAANKFLVLRHRAYQAQSVAVDQSPFRGSDGSVPLVPHTACQISEGAYAARWVLLCGRDRAGAIGPDSGEEAMRRWGRARGNFNSPTKGATGGICRMQPYREEKAPATPPGQGWTWIV